MSSTFTPPPADPEDRSPAFDAGWDQKVKELFAETSNFPEFYDPSAPDAPDDPVIDIASWPAFPRQLLRSATSDDKRWDAADKNRDLQDEYCEWAVEKEGDDIIAVTFTTEVPEYWEQLALHNDIRRRELYRTMVGREVERDELFTPDGAYDPQNDANYNTPSRIVHLGMGSNSLGAAVQLAAQATILRARNGVLVTDQQDLVCCGALGEPLRGSDPQIAIRVNRLAAQGADLSLQDPVGLYIQELRTNVINTPDGTDAADFWHIERGTPDGAVRGRFEVRGKPYKVGDLTIGGRNIDFGAQLADLLTVKITALAANVGKHSPTPQKCKRDQCPELTAAARQLPG